MRGLLIVMLLLTAACQRADDEWKSDYLKAVARWEAAYAGADAEFAYKETLAYAEYLQKMQRDGLPFDARRVLIWVYPRLGLLAEHLGKKDEAARYFLVAERYARAWNPSRLLKKSATVSG